MTESSGFEGALKRINEMAEVMQLTIPPSILIVLPEPRKWDFKVEGTDYHRTSQTVWPPSHCPVDIQTRGRRKGGTMPAAQISCHRHLEG